MKKIITFLLLIQSTLHYSQTILATYPLELKKSKEYRQIINAENKITHEFFAFISDKESLTILKYNSSLFLNKQFTLARPDISYKKLTGYSFDKDGNPTLYWSNQDLTKIMAIQYDLDNHTTSAIIEIELPLFNQSIITQFQENNIFYILAQKHFEEKLILYRFKDGKKQEKELDFSNFKFKNTLNQEIRLSKILEVCPIEKIETSQFNPLFKGTQRTKLYILRDKMLLTFDHNDNETQSFEIDLDTAEIQEKNYPKTATKDPVCLSNSYYHENKIYQFKANRAELLFEIKDYKTAESIKNINVLETEMIPFKTSPLWLQIENQKPREIKNTAKFLNQLVQQDVGLTVYKTLNSILITIGGTGITQFINNSYNENNAMFTDYPITTYFESVFDKKLEQTKSSQDPLAIDFISSFAQEHPEVSLSGFIRYKNYYILSYYDTHEKKYTMRKFIDGFER